MEPMAGRLGVVTERPRRNLARLVGGSYRAAATLGLGGQWQGNSIGADQWQVLVPNGQTWTWPGASRGRSRGTLVCWRLGPSIRRSVSSRARVGEGSGKKLSHSTNTRHRQTVRRRRQNMQLDDGRPSDRSQQGCRMQDILSSLRIPAPFQHGGHSSVMLDRRLGLAR